MANDIGNPPPDERRLRLRVKARQGRPRGFIWEIIHSELTGTTTIKQSSAPTFWTNMEAAYIAGSQALARLTNT